MWQRLPARITLSHPQSGNRKRFDAAHCISYDQPREHSQISTFCQPGHPRHGQSAAERGRAVACARLQSGSMASSSSEPWHPLAVGRGRLLLLNLNSLDLLPAAHAGASEGRTKRSCLSACKSSHTVSHAESHTLDGALVLHCGKGPGGIG